jgi:hypothetical protein
MLTRFSVPDRSNASLVDGQRPGLDIGAHNGMVGRRADSGMVDRTTVMPQDRLIL